MQPLQYDGCAEFHAENAEQFLRFMADIHNSKELVGEWIWLRFIIKAKRMAGCGSRFTDVDDGMHVMVGYDNLIYGSNIATSGGCDGILPSDPRIARNGSGFDGKKLSLNESEPESD